MLRLFILFCFVLTVNSYAKTIEQIAQETYLSNINTILIFTSQDSISSGTYRFTKVNITMDIYHLPFIYHIKSTKRYNSFLVGNLGYSKVYLSKDSVPIDGITLDYDSEIKTYTAGIGGGIRYNITKNIGILGGMEIIYSRSGSDIKTSNTDITSSVENIFNKNYTDNYTYKFFTLAEYNTTVQEFKPYASLGYKLYQTKSNLDLDSAHTFTTQSSVTTLTLGVESPKLYRYNANYLTLEGYFKSNYIAGDIAKTIKFDSYETAGFVTYWYTPDYPKSIKRFFIDINTVRSIGLEGYNVGIGFSANF